jgi:uncharacterized membrane protein
MKNLILIVALSTISAFTNAQLYFKNDSQKPVSVAYAMQNNEKTNEAWYSHGWFTVEPGENLPISSVIGLNRNIYFYAKSKDGEVVWDGKNRDGSVNFLVDPVNAFTIKNANLEYVKEENPTYKWVSFRHLYISGILPTKYTITIN